MIKPELREEVEDDKDDDHDEDGGGIVKTFSTLWDFALAGFKAVSIVQLSSQINL